jgi:hypothetical protein
MVLKYTIYCTQGEHDDYYTWMVLEYTIYCTQGEHDDYYTTDVVLKNLKEFHKFD